MGRNVCASQLLERHDINYKTSTDNNIDGATYNSNDYDSKEPVILVGNLGDRRTMFTI
jgi:hypothetical protein